jgi:hypothetical protein
MAEPSSSFYNDWYISAGTLFAVYTKGELEHMVWLQKTAGMNRSPSGTEFLVVSKT